MKKLKDMSKQELEEEYQAITETIEEIGCYGTKDLRWRDALEKEISQRGYEIKKKISLFDPEE